MPSHIRLSAPAKLNVYLRVLGRRQDGFHELETLFERIDLCDDLTFSPRLSGIELTCDDASLSCGPDNLIVRAARLLQESSGATQGASIHLVKRIPVAAGLGGGSSDAAATLLGLTQLWGLPLEPLRLRQLAAMLGSDVPFFLQPEAFAIGRGRGEICEPVSGVLRPLWHVLVVPAQRLSTKEIYEGFAKSRVDVEQADSQTLKAASGHQTSVSESALTHPEPSITMFVHALRNGSPGELAKDLANSLEPEAIRRCPVIQEIRDHLRGFGCVGIRVSGSGSAVFGLCRNEQDARTIACQLQRISRGWFVRVVTTLLPGMSPGTGQAAPLKTATPSGATEA